MADEVIRVMCPNLQCRRILCVPIGARGKTVRCKGCGANVRIPAEPPRPRSPAPVAADADSGSASEETVE